MKAIPMIFNTDMVKALLTGNKTVTRRPIKIPDGWQLLDKSLSKITSNHPKKGKWGAMIRKLSDPDFPQANIIPAPCATGDLIYVRETFATLHPGLDYQEISPWKVECQDIRYKASEREAIANEPDHEVRGYKWRPSIHMPKHCSRLTLKVTDVRIEKMKELRRDQDQISREGFKSFPQFRHAWRQIYGQCEPNDFVWVIEFEIINQNVDSYLMKAA